MALNGTEMLLKSLGLGEALNGVKMLIDSGAINKILAFANQIEDMQTTINQIKRGLENGSINATCTDCPYRKRADGSDTRLLEASKSD